MGIDPQSIRTIPAFGPDNKDFNQIMRAIALLDPEPELAIIESFGDMIEGRGFRREVRDFCSKVASYCQPDKTNPKGLTMIGVMETPKQNNSDKYPDPRQMVSGAAGWGYHSSSVFLIEGEDFTAKERTLSASIKNGPSFRINGAFNPQNRLIFNHLSPVERPLLLNMRIKGRNS